MKEARFKTLVQAYGADLDRWPADERQAATLFLDTDRGAPDWLAEARALDDLLDMSPAPMVSGVLKQRIIASAPRLERPVWRRGGAWISGAGLAAACMLGIFAGSNLPHAYFEDPAIETAEEASTVFDGTPMIDALETAQ